MALEECDARIRELYQQYLQGNEQKSETLRKLYDQIDSRIRQLDQTIRRYENEMRKGHFEAPAAPIDMRANSWARSDQYLLELNNSMFPGDPPLAGGVVAEDAERRRLSEGFDVPVDPNEPRYCLCKRESYGEMIGCDNEDCKIEWFHYGCVGLAPGEKLKTKTWYCPDCRVALGKVSDPSKKKERGKDKDKEKEKEKDKDETDKEKDKKEEKARSSKDSQGKRESASSTPARQLRKGGRPRKERD